MAGERSKRNHIYERHLLIANGIARCERTEIAESRVIDLKIDINLFVLEPRHQFLQLGKIGEIGFANVNGEIWMLLLQLVAQFIQPLLASRYQNEGSSSSGNLPRKFAADSSRCSRDQDATTVELHFFVAVVAGVLPAEIRALGPTRLPLQIRSLVL